MNQYFPKISKGFKYLATRVITFCLCILAVYCLFNDQKEIQTKTKIEVLNRLRPLVFMPFMEVVEGTQPLEKKRFDKYFNYFKDVVDVMPHLADANCVLGISYALLNKPQKAEEHLKRAAELKPDVYIFFHNLGIFYFQQKSYKSARWVMDKALLKHPAENIKYIYSSRVFLPFIIEANMISQKDIEQRIRDEYHSSEVLMILSDYYLGYYQEMYLRSVAGIKANSIQDGDMFLLAAVASLHLGQLEHAKGLFEEYYKKVQGDQAAQEFIQSIMPYFQPGVLPAHKEELQELGSIHFQKVFNKHLQFLLY